MAKELGDGHDVHLIHGGSRRPAAPPVVQPQAGQARLGTDAVLLEGDVVDGSRRPRAPSWLHDRAAKITPGGTCRHATTFGYPHFAKDSVFDAVDRVSHGLAAMLDGGEASR